MNAPLTENIQVKIEDLFDVVIAAVSIISKRLPSHIDRDDLTSVGFLALVEAFPRAPKLENEARAFLLKRVSGAIRDELRRADGAGRRTRFLLKRVRVVSEQFEQENGRVPSDAEVSSLIGESETRITEAHARAKAAQHVDLDNEVVEGVASESESPSSLAESNDRMQFARIALESLPIRQRMAVVRTILDGLTLSEVAGEMKVSIGRVAELRKLGLERLRLDPNLREAYSFR